MLHSVVVCNADLSTVYTVFRNFHSQRVDVVSPIIGIKFLQTIRFQRSMRNKHLRIIKHRCHGIDRPTTFYADSDTSTGLKVVLRLETIYKSVIKVIRSMTLQWIFVTKFGTNACPRTLRNISDFQPTISGTFCAMIFKHGFLMVFWEFRVFIVEKVLVPKRIVNQWFFLRIYVPSASTSSAY